jgi:ABC-type transporter Mla MlaB component
MPEECESPPTPADRAVYDDGILRMTAIASPPGLAIAGDVDEDTYPALVEKLEEFAGPAEIHLYLADVEYCDLAGLRAMIRLARDRPGSPIRRVVLHNVPPRLQAVLGIVGWDSTPGLVIDQRTSALRSVPPT